MEVDVVNQMVGEDEGRVNLKEDKNLGKLQKN